MGCTLRWAGTLCCAAPPAPVTLRGALSGRRTVGGLSGGLPSSLAAGGEGRLRGTSRGDMGERRGDAGEWARVKSGFIFPILLKTRSTLPQMQDRLGSWSPRSHLCIWFSFLY